MTVCSQYVCSGKSTQTSTYTLGNASRQLPKNSACTAKGAPHAWGAAGVGGEGTLWQQEPGTGRAPTAPPPPHQGPVFLSFPPSAANPAHFPQILSRQPVNKAATSLGGSSPPRSQPSRQGRTQPESEKPNSRTTILTAK